MGDGDCSPKSMDIFSFIRLNILRVCHQEKGSMPLHHTIPSTEQAWINVLGHDPLNQVNNITTCVVKMDLYVIYSDEFIGKEFYWEFPYALEPFSF